MKNDTVSQLSSKLPQPKRALLIVNPISGTAGKEGLPDMVRDYLPEYKLEVCYTKGRGDATRLARMAVESGIHTVIAAGGDGTVNETAIALRDTRVVMGIIPCGSGNGLARHLNIDIDVESALRVIRSNHIEACDYGTVNGHPFFCTFGVGFDAAVSNSFAKCSRRGRLTYLRETFLEYTRYRPQIYVITRGDTGEVITDSAFLVAVCNASQYGNNAYIAPNATMTDGLLDITLIHSGNPISTALVGVDLLTGYIDRNNMIDTLKVPAVTIERQESGPVHLDGEPMEMGRHLDIVCHPGGLNLYTPVKQEDFKPLITPVRALMRDIHYAFLHIFRNGI